MNSEPMAGFQLSPLQRQLWRQQQNHAAAFRAQALISIEGKLDLPVLRAALGDVVARHEILRTTFRSVPDLALPAQVIMPEVPESGIELGRELDWRNFSAAQQDAKIAALFQEAKALAFDFALRNAGSLLRLTPVVLTPAQRLLLVALPALCADAATLNNLTREISRAYQARLDNAEYANGVMQYADIAQWQNDLLETAEGEPGKAFWRKQNLHPPPRVKLPFAAPPKAETGFHPLVFSMEMPAALAAKIAGLAQQRHVAVSAFLLACVKILLWRLTGGENEIVVGVNFAGRKYDELKEALGLFAKFLPVRCPLQAPARFRQILAQVHAAAEELDPWQDFFSWEKLNGKLEEGAAPPFFPFCFERLEPPEKFSAGEASFSILQQYVCADRFDLKLACAPAGRLEFHYNANVYQAEDIERFAAQYLALAESALDRPEAAIGEFNILPAAERRRLLFDFNDTAAAYPTDQCIHHVIEAQAQRQPDRVAVIFNEQTLTYGELNTRANQLAHRLRALGVGPNVIVGIGLERSLEMIIGVLAILKAGGAYLPLDPAYPKERLSLMLEDTQAPVLVTKQLTIDNYQLTIDNSKLQVICLDADADAIAQESRENPASAVMPDNLVYMIYTSGSTGKPKGVVISHQDLIISNRARMAYFQQPVHKFLLLSSLSFDSSVVGIFWTLCEGGALFLVPGDLQQNMVELAEIIERHQISHLLALPSFYALLLEYAQTRQIDCLQTVIVAGEACPKKMVERHKEMLAPTALFSEYGATETTVFSSVYDCLQQTLSLAPVGDPIDNAQMYVLDARQQPQPVNVPGEVYFGGDALSKGYWKRPDLTAEKFIPHPFSARPGERLYKSGDLAQHLPNGDIEFLGRLDNQVKIRGFRIELEEIEAALSQHPAVREAAVEARPSTALGGSKRLIGYVALSHESPATIGELRRYLAEKLPDYMVPAQFVKLDSLPKNPNGKIDRRALPDPGEERPELEENFVAAQTAVEKKLAEIWAEVLRVDKVGVYDNFFELGGDSILSIQIISQARQAGLHLTPVQMFQYQTIAELAKVVGTKHAMPAEQGLVVGSLPLTPIQQWFFEKNLLNPNHWNVSLLLEVRREISAAHLQQAAQKLLEHHDALRLHFDKAAIWQQTCTATEQVVPLVRVDVSACKDDEQMAAIEERTAEFQAKLNLANGPLMRFVRFDRGVGKNSYLLWVLHHLACDVVSWRIMIEDLQTALQQLSRGEKIQLPAKTTSFKHWAERLAEYAQAETVANELDYWTEALPAHLPKLPVDYQNGIEANTEESTRAIKVYLTAEETRALLQEVPKAYNTQINDALLTAFAQAFVQWTGAPSVLLDLEGHGREDILGEMDLSRTVGWFTVFYPVCLRLNAGADAGEALRAIKEQLRCIPNRGFGYSLLRYLNADPQIGEKIRRLPQAQINFNYLGQFDQALQESAGFGLVQETNIYDRYPAGPRSHVLEIVGIVVRGCLQVEWSYSANLHRAETISALAEAMRENLRAIIRHCRAAEAKVFAPADFAEFDWDQNELSNIAAAIVKSKGTI